MGVVRWIVFFGEGSGFGVGGWVELCGGVVGWGLCGGGCYCRWGGYGGGGGEGGSVGEQRRVWM